MKKQFLSKLSCSKVFAALAIIGGVVSPLSSAQADTSQIQADRLLVGESPTNYRQFSQPAMTSGDQGSLQTRQEGPQGPIRTDEMNDFNDSAMYPATSAGQPEQSAMDHSRQSANLGLYSEQPSNYRWYE